MRFYGCEGHTVRQIRIPGNQKILMPHDVPERVVSRARRGRTLVIDSKHLVAHSGVALFKNACNYLATENLCGPLLELDSSQELRQPKPRLELAPSLASPAGACAAAASFAAAAALMESNTLGPVSIFDLCVNVTPSQPPNVHAAVRRDQSQDAALAASLTALADSLAHMRTGGQRATFNLGEALCERRHVMLFLRGLERSLRATTGLALLELSAYPDTFREDDVARLNEAARLGWAERALVVLHGTSANGQSPLRLLPTALVRTILDMAANICRVSVTVSTEPLGGVAALAAALPPAALSPHAGADLDFIAGLM